MLVLEDLGNQYGWEKINPTSSTGITASLLKPTAGPYKGMQPKAVLIAVETNPIRIRMDSTAPTATNGVQLKADTYFTIVNAENIKYLLMIDTAAGAADVHVLPYF